MSMGRKGRVLAVIAAAMLLAEPAALAAAKRPAAAETTAESLNPPNDKLEHLPPNQQAAQLAHAIGHWCIGTEVFQMGLEREGRAKGNAYWSLRCADGSTWAIQVDPRAGVTAIDCDSFNERAIGKACFKKF